jgi:predicted extracellular nuclease/2',3'-cyclic-nucleotide 2'-phosphodiesterase (5'-nucleotidase family)
MSVKLRILIMLLLAHTSLWAQQVLEIPIVSSGDDVEELGPLEGNTDLSPGDLDLESSDLELVDDNSWNGPGLTVGLMFRNFDFPKGTVINSAHIEFAAKASDSDPTSLVIGIEDLVDATPFANTPYNISSRAILDTIQWNNLEAWTSGDNYQSPDLSGLITDIMNKPNWVEGGNLVFVITGSGVRNAQSFDGGTAPVLVIDYDSSSLAYSPKIDEVINDVEIGTDWDYTLDVDPYFSDRDSELTFTAVESGLGSLPTWLSMNGSVLSGTPTASGSFMIEVNAEGGGEDISQTFEIVVTAPADFTLAIFHNNDGESDLLSNDVTYNGEEIEAGSVAQFKYTLDSLRTQASNRGYESIMLSSGDNFLAGLEYNASVANGVAYDAVALEAIEYDAIDLGNHDFDFGTQVLANYIGQVTAPYLTSNLSFENVPELQALKNAGEIKPYTIVSKGGEDIGVIGLTTPLLPIISSPGNTTVSEAIADSVQKYVDVLEGLGVNKIILISHLQGLTEDLALVPQIEGLDIVIAGGGDELLANNALIGAPYNTDPYDSYPIISQDQNGESVYIVTTPGGYRYLGNLLVDFDAAGKVVNVYSSNPVFVHGASDPALVTNVETPIETYIGALATNVLATSNVDLDFRKETLRVMETNGGNLFADALLYQGQKDAPSFGVNVPQVAFQNAGGLRIASIVPSGDFTEDLTYQIAAFTNIVSVVENVAPSKFLELMEFGLAETPTSNGRFPQIAGFKVVFDPTKAEGERIKSIELEDGTMIIEDGAVAVGAPDVNICTVDFTANGGDGYPFDTLTYTSLGATYQQALTNYLVNADALNGEIVNTAYPVEMNERIIEELSEIPPISALLIDEDFDDCDNGFPSDWISYSVASNADWDCSDDTRGASGNAGDYAAEMNGYGADVASEDWLISPEFVLSGEDAYLSFSSMSKWSGPHIEILISANYDGTSDPNGATWDNISEAEDNAAQNDSYDYVDVEDVLLESLDGTYRIAFKYVSTGTGGGDGTTYTIDNVELRSSCLLDEDFNTACNPGPLDLPEGWTLYETNTVGLVNCNSEGYEDDADDYSLRFNGYAVGDGEAWLVTPRLDFSTSEFVLEFASKRQYSGPDVEVVYSFDYTGVGDPNNANWTNLPDAESAITSSFQTSGPIELDGLDAPGFIAFKYTSLGTSGGQSLNFLLDEVSVKEPAVITELGHQAIYEIQGTDDEAALVNSVVTTSGIITAVFNGVEPYMGAGYDGNIKGFFMQDVAGDGNPSTSDGIYVYTTDTLMVGDSVVVSGEVQEYFGNTQLSNLTQLDVVSGGHELPMPVKINLPLSSVDDFEAYESMLVEFEQLLTVTENRNVNIYHELKLSANGVLMNPTEIVDVNDVDPNGVTADGDNNVGAVTAQQDENDANYVILDDARSGNYLTPEPYVDMNGTVRAGSTVDSVIGVLLYSFSEYRVYPTHKPKIDFSDREGVPSLGASEVVVATFNVENYFNGDGQGGGFPTSRGAETEADFVLQTGKIVSALVEIDADVVGLIEIENDANDGFSALKTLVDSVNNRLGSNEYAFVSTGVVKRGDNTNDEIKNAFIYKTSTISLVGNYAILNDTYDPNYNDSKNRPSLAQTFEEIATGERITALINHLKSKGSGCDDLDDPNLSDGQGNCNGTRTLAAGVMVDWINSDPTSSNDPDFFILGDLNSYNQEDPIDTLRARGYVNLNEGDYTYVYDGQFGSLDYAMANASAEAQVVDAYVWHINSVEPYGLSYDIAGANYTNSPFRSSDHDPVVIGLQLDADVGVTETEISEVTMYPNPTTGNVHFSAEVSGQVYSFIGSLVKSFTNTTTLNFDADSKGLYYIRLNSGELLKLIVE